MKSLVENAKEFSDISLFFSESHLCYQDLKGKDISWASSSCRGAEKCNSKWLKSLDSLLACMSEVQDSWLQVLLVQGLTLYHKCKGSLWIFLWSASAVLAPCWGGPSPHGDQVAPSSPTFIGPWSKSSFKDLASLRSFNIPWHQIGGAGVRPNQPLLPDKQAALIGQLWTMSSLATQGSFQSCRIPWALSRGPETRSEAELRGDIESSNNKCYHIKSYFSHQLLIFHFASTSRFLDLGAIDIWGRNLHCGVSPVQCKIVSNIPGLSLCWPPLLSELLSSLPKIA